MLDIKVNNIKLNRYFTNPRLTFEINSICFFEFTYPLTDELSGGIKTSYTVEFLYNNENIFTGYIDRIDKRLSNDGYEMSITGNSILSSLQRKYIPPNIMASDETLTNLLDNSYPNTINKNSAITFTGDTNVSLTYLYSLQSSLSAIRKSFNLTDRKFRYIGGNTVEVFKESEPSEFEIQMIPDNCDLENTDQLFIDSTIGIEENANNLFNYAFALGGTSDNGINQLTLRDVSTSIIEPNFPIFEHTEQPNTDTTYAPDIYDNVESAPNTYTAFIVKNLSSITKYGEIHKSVTLKDIHPVTSNKEEYTNADRIESANQLYKATVGELKRYGEIERNFTFTLAGAFKKLKVGTYFDILLNKEIVSSGEQSGSLDPINEVVRLNLVSYSINFEQNNVIKYSTVFSNVLDVQKDDIEILSDTIEVVQDYQRQRKGSVNYFANTLADSFDSAFPLKGFFYVPRNFMYVDYCYLKVEVKPFRSYSTGATTATIATTTVASATTSTATATSSIATATTTIATATTSTASATTSVATATTSTATASTTASGGATVQTSSSAAAHSHTVTIPSHTHFLQIIIGNGTSPQPLYYQPASPPFVCPGGGLVLGDVNMTSASGGGSVQTSTSNGVHDHTVSIPSHAHNFTIPALAVSIPSLSVPIPALTVNIPALTVNIPALTVNIPALTVNIPPLTVNIPPAPVTLIYGIFEDTANPPSDLKLFIDGIDYSGQINIPNGFGIYPVANNEGFDIMTASNTLGQFSNLFKPGYHAIELRCGSGRARGELNFGSQFYLSAK